MTIDPGIGGTGVALWDAKRRLISYYNISSKEDNWLDAAKDIASSSVFFSYDFEFIAFEMPSNFSTSSASIAAGKRGDILKLSILIGMIIESSRSVCHNHIPVLVQTWKGNTEKKLMNDRVRRIFNADRDQPGTLDSKLTTHVLDAIGIGLYLQGKL